MYIISTEDWMNKIKSSACAMTIYNHAFDETS
jgi:hypothetical protein